MTTLAFKDQHQYSHILLNIQVLFYDIFNILQYKRNCAKNNQQKLINQAKLASARQIIEQLRLSDQLADIYEQTKISTEDNIETIHGKLYQRIKSLHDYLVRLNLINETQQSKIYEYKHKQAELELQNQYLLNLVATIRNNKKDDILLNKIEAENKRRLIEQQILEIKNKIEVNYDRKRQLQQKFLDKQSQLEQDIDHMQFLTHRITNNSMVKSINDIHSRNNAKRQDMMVQMQGIVMEIADILNLQLPVKHDVSIAKQLNSMYQSKLAEQQNTSQTTQQIKNKQQSQLNQSHRQPHQNIQVEHFENELSGDGVVYSSQHIPENLKNSQFQTINHPKLLYLDCETDQVKDVYMTNNLHEQLKSDMFKSKKIPQKSPEITTYADGEKKLFVPDLTSSFLQNLTTSVDESCQVNIKDRKAQIQNLKIDKNGNVLEKVTSESIIKTKLVNLKDEMNDFKTKHQFKEEFHDVRTKYAKRVRKVTPLEIDLRKQPFKDEMNDQQKVDVYWMNMQTADVPPKYQMKLIRECQDGLFIDNEYVPDAAKKLKQLTYEYNQLRAMYDTYMRASNFNMMKKLQVKIKHHLQEMQKLNAHIAKEEQRIKERKKQEQYKKQILKQSRLKY